jgi:hypothetical protein
MLIHELAGADLAAVTFVRDYLHFQFEATGETWNLNVYTAPVIHGPDGHTSPGKSGYRDALVELVNATVREANAGPDEVSITFADTRSLVISRRPDDQRGPEAATLSDEQSSRWYVW